MDNAEIPKAYDPKAWEDDLYRKWEESGFFRPEADQPWAGNPDTRERYCNVLPPPNANGELHLGHASGYTVMDILGRFERMKGKKTLLLPGKDHAGIQTQVVFEKKLHAERGITRHDLGRDEFYQETYDFCMDRASYMRSQEKRIGLSADWSREMFTLDPAVSERVRETFKKMYDDGMIYRGERIINWCPRCATALSDVEVVHEETGGKLYFITYPVKDSGESVTVATTRPETMLGDTAVAVHPDDGRYRALVGKTVILPLVGREIPIIADKRIDPAFGTGAVKITPAHDPLDWEIGETHGLPIVSVIGTDAKITPEGGVFSGLSVEEARTKVLEALGKEGMFGKEEPHTINRSSCERCKTTIEPLVSRQWFVDVDAEKYSLKQRSIEAIRSGAITFYPENMKEQMIRWLENLHDWCISRQLWWGHRIPVYYCLNCKKERIGATPKSRWFFVRHGETDWNKDKVNAGATDIPLNETGRSQARLAAEKLASENIGVIFSSHLSRAHETAKIIGEKIGVNEIIIDDRLQERHMGEAEGMSYTEVKERYPDMRTYNGKSAGNESYAETEERIWSAISEHLKEHNHRNVLITSHGATLRALWRRIRNVSPEAIMDIEKFSNATPLSVDTMEPCKQCGHHFFEQDTDTLDTWFSSGQWPYTTLGYPDGDDSKKFYPTDTMVMGRDLLFFWATRMIMFGLYRTGNVPFRELYFTGLVRDKEGRKMSKSKGTGIDVLEMIDRYGADAVRLSLTIGTTPGLDFRLSDEKIASFRNFTNKLWNIGRYVGTQSTGTESEPEAKTPADHWILDRTETVAREVTRLLENRQVSLAGETLRAFTWDDFADWYVEAHKVERNDALLRHVFDTILRLWHPFMPFVTEAIHEMLKSDKNQLLMISPWPVFTGTGGVKSDFEDIRALITRIRNLRSVYHIDPGTTLTISITTELPGVTESIPVIERLARVSVADAVTGSAAKVIVSEKLSTHVALEGVIDIGKEKTRLEGELANAEKYAASLEAKLGNPAFAERAPKELVENTQKLLGETRAKADELRGHVASLS